MNFLSHFYFDRDCTDAYQVLGSVMPDLLRNADKNAQIKPERLPEQTDAAVNSIIIGWKKHLAVDKYFHSSAFFKFHANELRLLLAPALAGSPVKPFFLGHIALELMLDNLLLTSNTVFADDFYEHLSNAEQTSISTFLTLNGAHPQKFLSFYTVFINEKYLYSYSKAESVAYALKGICSRIWQKPFTKNQENAVIEIITFYIQILNTQFMEVFHEMETLLSVNNSVASPKAAVEIKSVKIN